MTTATEPPVSDGAEAVPYPISSDVYFGMVEAGLIPEDRPVFLSGGMLYEKVPKVLPYWAIRNAYLTAVGRRLPLGFFVGCENPVRLDDLHTLLPDVIACRGEPFDRLGLNRHADGREVVLVIEICLERPSECLGRRLSRYAATLPVATFVVADVKSHRVLVHRGARPSRELDRGTFAKVETVGPGQAIRLEIGGVILDPIPFEEVMR
jgi:hypothetical protein